MLVLPHPVLCEVSQKVMSHSLPSHGLQPARLLCPWDFPGKHTEVACHFLLQGIFPTQGSNGHLLHLLHCREILYHLSHQGSPYLLESESESRSSCLTLCDPMDCSPPGSSVHGILQPEYWSGLPFPSPGDLPNPGSNPGLLHCRQVLYHLSHQRRLTISWSLLRFISIELVTLSNHLILSCPLLILPSTFSSIRIFSNESALRIK